MKCALELEAIRAEAEAKNIVAKEAHRLQLEAKKVQDTIRYCENIGKALEKMAEAGETPKISLVTFSHLYSKKEFCIAIPTRKDYADRKLSYRLGDVFNIELMAAWFDKYCFTVSIEEALHGEYVYGWGRCKAYTIKISPVPCI